MSTESTPDRRSNSNSNRVLIFDTTLRDGEQSPGATMTFEEKLQVADLLDDMGVDIIEAGFPIASEGDFEAVGEIARRAKRAVIAGWRVPARGTSTVPGRRCVPPVARESTPSSRLRRCI